MEPSACKGPCGDRDATDSHQPAMEMQVRRGPVCEPLEIACTSRHERRLRDLTHRDAKNSISTVAQRVLDTRRAGSLCELRARRAGGCSAGERIEQPAANPSREMMWYSGETQMSDTPTVRRAQTTCAQDFRANA